MISWVAVWFPKLSPPATAAANEEDTLGKPGILKIPPILEAPAVSNLPYEPVEVDEPLIFPPISIFWLSSIINPAFPPFVAKVITSFVTWT